MIYFINILIYYITILILIINLLTYNIIVSVYYTSLSYTLIYTINIRYIIPIQTVNIRLLSADIGADSEHMFTLHYSLIYFPLYIEETRFSSEKSCIAACTIPEP